MPGPKFVDTTVDTAMAHPWTSSVGTRYRGMPFFLDMKSGEIIPFDPWWLKANGFIKSTTMLIYGPLDHGKSALVKMLAYRLALYVWGFSLFRIVINDRKPEGSEGEYGALSRFFGCIPYTMRDMQVNPFERRLFLHSEGSRELYELGLLEIAQLLSEFEFGQQSPLERYALRVALYDMLTNDTEAAWGTARLQRISLALQPDMLKGYQNNLDDRLTAQTEDQLRRVEDESLKARIRERTWALKSLEPNLRFEDLVSAGVANAARLGSLLHGPLGTMFGAKHSLYDMQTQRAVDKDWRGVPQLGETLMHTLETRLKTMAGELNRTDLLPHMEINDELHKSMDNLTFAETLSYAREVARSIPTLQVDSTHTPDSIRKGGVGSQIFGIANKIIDNTALQFYGAMPNKQGLLDEIQEREGLLTSERNALPSLERHVFAAKFGPKEPLMLLHPVTTPLDHAWFIDTNSATENIMNRPSVLSPEDMRKFAEVNDLTYVGP